MKIFLFRLTTFLALIFSFAFFSPVPTLAQSQADELAAPATQDLPDVYYRARVNKILEEGKIEVDGQLKESQKIEIEILHGDKKGQKVNIDHGGIFEISPYQKVSKGEVVVLAHPPRTPGAIRDVYYIVDKYRLPALGWMTLIFLALAICFGGRRGFTAVLGLLFSILVIFYFIIPRILNGADPLTTCLLGSLMIIFISLYLSHGFNRRTTIALVSSVLSLALAVGIDILFVSLAGLSGVGTEEAFYLQFDAFSINLRGVLLGGIILGVLGVLDDVTTGQSAAVEEIHLANPGRGFRDLYRRGISVGREHITSLINTLVLAYVGVSFPLLLLYNSQKLLPLWIVINSNFIAEEIVRTLVGSTVLVAAIPLTTALAAVFYSNKK